MFKLKVSRLSFSSFESPPLSARLCWISCYLPRRLPICDLSFPTNVLASVLDVSCPLEVPIPHTQINANSSVLLDTVEEVEDVTFPKTGGEGTAPRTKSYFFLKLRCVNASLICLFVKGPNNTVDQITGPSYLFVEADMSDESELYFLKLCRRLYKDLIWSRGE